MNKRAHTKVTSNHKTLRATEKIKEKVVRTNVTINHKTVHTNVT